MIIYKDNAISVCFFPFRPVTQNTVLQCRITRDKHGLDHGMYPIYHLHMEESNGQKVWITAGFIMQFDKYL